MTTRIRWTDEERALVYRGMVAVYTEGKRSSKEAVLRDAQLGLPIGRRRKIYPTMLHNLKGWMEQARLEAHTAARDRKLTEVALANKPVEPASVPPPEPTPLGLGDLFERLVDELAKRVASEVAKALSEQLSVKPVPDTFEHTYKHVEYGVKGLIEAQTPATPKVRRKRVLIIGLKGQQVTVVEQKYPDIDFTFMTSDEAQGRSPGEADWTIMMTKFINHAVYSKYRHVPNMHHCNGGVSDLGGIIQTIRNS